MNDNAKRGRGRPKGSTGANIVNINLQDLLEKIGDRKELKVSRKWLLSLEDEPVKEDIEFKVS
jgi:hypothetical protein